MQGGFERVDVLLCNFMDSALLESAPIRFSSLSSSACMPDVHCQRAHLDSEGFVKGQCSALLAGTLTKFPSLLAQDYTVCGLLFAQQQSASNWKKGCVLLHSFLKRCQCGWHVGKSVSLASQPQPARHMLLGVNNNRM